MYVLGPREMGGLASHTRAYISWLQLQLYSYSCNTGGWVVGLSHQEITLFKLKTKDGKKKIKIANNWIGEFNKKHKQITYL